MDYDTLDINHPEDRLANVYYPNPLYNPERHKEHLKAIESEYGKARALEGLEILKVLNEDNDYNGLEAILKLEDKYSKEVLQEALAQLSSRRDDNPKRSLPYYLGIVKKMGVEKLDNEIESSIDKMD